MPSEPLWYGFADESGDSNPFSDTPLVLAAVVTAQPRSLVLPVQRALKKWGTSLTSGELKAVHSSELLITKMLQDIAKANVSIVTVVLDKSVIVRPPRDHETLYWASAGRLLRLCVERWPRIEFTFDKRYTNKWQERELERFLRGEIADLTNTIVTIYQQDSLAEKELQAADFIAWAAGRKLKGRDEYWRLLAGKSVAEEAIRRDKW